MEAIITLIMILLCTITQLVIISHMVSGFIL
jgi:hypothetical protein